MITDTVPSEARFVSSEPGAMVSGNKLSWRIEEMACGDCEVIKYELEPKAEGCLIGCVSIIAIPQTCVGTFVGQAKLEIEKHCSCHTIQLGDSCHYDIVVRNVGTTVARNVVVTDTLPDHVQHSSGDQVLVWELGDLGCNECVNIPLTVCLVERGEFRNVVTATADNAEKVAAKADCLCVKPMIDIVKSGAEKQFIGKSVDYSIVVKNPGDVELTGLVITDYAPRGTCIVDAPGACVSGNRATWQLDSLAPGASETFVISLCTSCCGTYCNKVVVETCEGVCDESCVCTEWTGHPALLIEVVDTCDPLLEGECTCYRIRIVNQGTATDHNVQVIARFPAELSPESACGATAGSVDGKTVTFAPYDELCPRQCIEYLIKAKAMQAGDGRLKVELHSDTLAEPVIEEESTHVY
jgi:uncharacterized repeat protein (TIGR01451 family)